MEAALFVLAVVLVLLVLAGVVGLGLIADLRRRLTRLEAQSRAQRTELDRQCRALGELRQAPAPGVAAAPTVPTPVPPADTDYAAAEAELRAAETRDDGVDEETSAAGAEGASEPSGEQIARPPVPAPVAAAVGALGDLRSRGARLRERATEETRERTLSLEAFVGGRVLLVAGVVVVLFALGFFLKFAIDRELIAPPVRVAIGVVAGAAALFAGDRLRGRGFDIFGHAVMGGGLGALFLSTFFAAARYELIDQVPAFGVTAVISALGTVVAIRREAPLLAYLGFVGGYLAPTILGSNTDALEGLTGWLVVLHLGVLAVLWFRRWPGLDLLALGASSVYLAAWADHYLVPARMAPAAIAIGALTLVVLAIALAPAIARRRPVGITALLTAILAGSVSATAGFEFFFEDHRVALGCTLLVLGALYVAAGRGVRREASSARVAGPVLEGCALAAVAAAVPALLDGGAIAPSWAASGLVAMFLAARGRVAVVAAGGVVVIALAQVHLLAEMLPMHDGPFVPFVNGAFFGWASPSVALVLSGLILRWQSPWRTFSGICLGAGAWLYAPVLFAELMLHFVEDPARYGRMDGVYGGASGISAVALLIVVLALAIRGRRAAAILVPLGPLALLLLFSAALLSTMDRPGYVPIANALFPAGVLVLAAAWATTAVARGPLRGLLLIASVAAGLGLIATECVAYVENAVVPGASEEDLIRTAHVAASVASAIYAGLLLVAGFSRDVAAVRWCGLAVFTLTIGKVFLVDMAELPTLHRVAGFLVLGLALLAGSFLYQRARRSEEKAA